MSRTVLISLVGCVTLFLPFTFIEDDFNSFFAISSVIFLFFTAVLLWLKEKEFFVLYSPFFVSTLWVSISNVYIEHGGYIQEQLRFGEPSGSTVRYVLFSFVFILSAYISFKMVKIKGAALKYKTYNLQLYFVYSFFSFLILLLVLSLVFYGVPLFGGVDRFFYRANLPIIFLKVFPFVQLACFLLGVVSYQRGALIRGLCMMLLMFMMLVLHAEKFTLLFWGGVFFAAGYISARLIDGRDVKAFRPALICLVLLTFFLTNVVFNYHIVHGIPYDKIFSQIMQRAFGLQGHVWYGVDTLRMSGWEGLDSLESFFSPHTESKPSGLVAIMYEISPKSLVESYREKGVTFTMGSPATALASFGYIGVAAYQLFGGLVVGGVLGYISNSILRDNYAALFASLVALKVCMQTFLMGDFFELYSPVMMVFYAFVVLDVVSRNVFLDKSIRSWG